MGVRTFRLHLMQPKMFLFLFATLLYAGGCSGDGRRDTQNLTHEGILGYVSADRLRVISRDLTAIGPRYCGTEGETQARNYVAGRFAQMGLDVSFQPFTYTLWNPVSLEMDLEGPEAGPVPGVSLGFSPSTPPAGLSAQTVYVGRGLKEDYTKLTWAETFGKIHLADSAADTNRTILYLNAQLHWAAGFVHMKTWKGDGGESLVEVGSVQPLATIPAVAVDKETGDRLRRTAGRRLTIRAVNRTEPSASASVRAVLQGRSEEFITVGAHFDSWYVGESAADNASGIAAMLETARILAEHYDLERSIHFLAFSAEELDLQGSINYAIQNLTEIISRCRLMVVFDICGLAGGTAEITASPGELGEEALAEAERIHFTARTGSGIEITPDLDLGSDHLPYLVLGVPTLYINKTPFIYYHTRYDTLDRLDFRSMRYEVALAAQIIATEAGAVPRSR
jgi:aminopeptidase YwaD